MPRFVPGTVASPELAATVTVPKESKLAELGCEQDGMIVSLHSHGAVLFRMAARRTFPEIRADHDLPRLPTLTPARRPGKLSSSNIVLAKVA
jgi:hypothetical protein